jgi:threonine/homoserine/homoserine lactone efflux protein
MVSIAGGALLTSYGIAGLRGATVEVEESEVERTPWASLGKGVSVNFLNPNPYLFWLTIGTPLLLEAHTLG